MSERSSSRSVPFCEDDIGRLQPHQDALDVRRVGIDRVSESVLRGRRFQQLEEMVAD